MSEAWIVTLLAWLLMATLSFFLGARAVRFLTTHPVNMAGPLFGATLALAGVVALAITGVAGPVRWIGLGISLVAALAGYSLATWLVLNPQERREIPALTRTAGDPGLGHTAVVYFAHGEPETYNPIGWIHQFREFDEQHIRFVPFLARPFFLYQLRKSYLLVGKSDHRSTHRRILQKLEKAYRDRGDRTTRFYLCFLDDEPRPDAAVITALNEGAGRIVVAEVFLSVSNHTAEGKELIEALPLEELGVPVHFTGPLWDSAPLKRMFVEKVEEHLDGADPTQVGVLLVGHGQPDEWDEAWPTETAHEIEFRRQVLALLEEAGYPAENLSMAWMEFKEPKPAAAIETFVRNGVEQIFYFSAAISAEALHSQCDVPRLIEKAPIPQEVRCTNLGAWNDHPRMIEALQEKIDAQMDDGLTGATE